MCSIFHWLIVFTYGVFLFFGYNKDSDNAVRYLFVVAFIRGSNNGYM